MERIRAVVPKISRAERLDYYHEHAYNHDHLRLGISTSQYHRRKQAQILRALDTLLELFDSSAPSAASTAPALDSAQVLPDFGIFGP
jgi:endonuclease III